MAGIEPDPRFDGDIGRFKRGRIRDGNVAVCAIELEGFADIAGSVSSAAGRKQSIIRTDTIVGIIFGTPPTDQAGWWRVASYGRGRRGICRDAFARRTSVVNGSDFIGRQG